MIPIIPKKIGHYDVKSEISDNGRTKVLHGHELGFDGDVAIKILPGDFLQEASFRARFEREMQIIALLDHPAIVPIYDLGELDGHPYIVMRYMPGGSLVDRLASGPLSVEEAFRIIGPIASALDAVHEKGIVHGNIKPENIFFDENDEPYLADFSLVKPVASSATSILNIVSGTPAYMSPEQAQGRPDLDGRSDIYSLGVVLYKMLSGRLPFEADTAIKLAVQQVSTPVPDILEINPHLPPGCQVVIAQAMAKDPDQRDSTAGEMSSDLALIVEDLSAIPFPQQRWGALATDSSYMPDTPIRPKKRLRWVLTSLLFLVLLGISISIPLGVIDVGHAKDNLLALLHPVSPTLTSTPAPTLMLSITPSPTPLPTSTQTETITPVPALAPAATLTYTPSPTLEPSSTPLPSLTPTIAPTFTPLPPVIGEADKIAFLNENDIWTANLDGSELERITQDKVFKDDLQWTPDGQALTFWSEKCFRIVRPDDRLVRTVGCFAEFEISPDMSKVVIGDDVMFPNETKRWLNFILPYDLDTLMKIKEIPKEPAMGGCPFFGGRLTRFSPNGGRLAAVFEAPGSGRRVDTIQVFTLGTCGGDIDIDDMFPSDRFKMRGYSGPTDSPKILDFTWDGAQLFALHGDVTNGFGDLVIYNMGTGRADVVNPMDNQCCYRDLQFSPDGQYLLFAFKDARYVENVRLYYVPYGSIGTGTQYTPLSLPDYFFGDPTAKIEPALRPATP